jgi:hypothetical protein
MIMVLLPILVYASLLGAGTSGGWFKHLLLVMAFICGGVGGRQYALSANCLSRGRDEIGGNLYALDLFGSAIGALMIGLILLPISGFLASGLFISIISIPPLLLVSLRLFKIHIL